MMSSLKQTTGANKMSYFAESDLDDLMYSPEYADFLMEHCDRQCGSGDQLLELMEEGYMFDEFVKYFESVCKTREVE